MAPKGALPIETRRSILQREIANYISHGYRVVSQTDTTAQLVKPKSFGCGMLLVSVVTLGLALILYLMAKDSQVYIVVDEDGNVKRRS